MTRVLAGSLQNPLANLDRLSLPSWLTELRPHQTTAIDAILDAFTRTNVVICDAPTGAGKSVIAEVVRQCLANEYPSLDFDPTHDCCHDGSHQLQDRSWCCDSAHERPRHRSLYVATTKPLQRQVVKDFPYAKILMGRQNYATLDAPSKFPFLTAGDCDKTRGGSCASCQLRPDEDESHCSHCHPWVMCPYQVAKRECLSSPLGVTNTAYFLHLAAYDRAYIPREFVILDEADELEDQLVNFVEVGMSARLRENLGIDPPKQKGGKNGPSIWMEWIHEVALPALDEARRNVTGSSIESFRERKKLKEIARDLEHVDLESGEWIYSGHKAGDVIFKPVRVHDWAPRVLWPHSKKFLLMSATIISADALADDLGLTDYESVVVPSTFPAARRPINFVPVADLSRKEDIATNGQNKVDLVDGIVRVATNHPTERILIHSVSYALTKFLTDQLPQRLTPRTVLWYNSPRDRDRVLNRFRQTPGAVLVAPSLDRGIDLPHDACRVVIVAKIAFPDLSDELVNARLHSKGGEVWYSVKAVRTLVQMVGRGMRSEDDWCMTVILDRQFGTNVYRRSKHLLPGWFREAVDLHGRRKVETA